MDAVATERRIWFSLDLAGLEVEALQGDSASTADFIAVAQELGGQTAVDILNDWLYSDIIPAKN